MRRFLEKSFVALICLYNSITSQSGDIVLYFLISLAISMVLDLIKPKRIRVFIYIAFFTLYFFNPLFIYYIPLIMYNIYMDFNFYVLFTIPFILNDFSILGLGAAFVAIYFAIRTNEFDNFIEENKIVRDELKEDTLYLKKYNEQLEINAQKNVHIAILTERNRIARELHDSIGHAISSSILQVEALKVISDNNMVESLSLLQNTLKNGMNDIRKSIHNLHNESLDLKSKIEDLCSEVPSLDIDLLYRLEDDLSYDLKFDILSVIKEAITNCIKHSNATKFQISLLAQPKFYSIIIKDNGNKFDNVNILDRKGIGLISMKEIASKYNGFLNYKFEDGFRIHLTLMKG